jgi:hypothetical protein
MLLNFGANAQREANSFIDGDSFTLSVFNTNGQLVSSFKFNSGIQKINVNEFIQGIYYIEIKTNSDFTHHEKFIKID